MDAALKLTAIRRLGVALVIMTFVLMVLGSWVKATSSGLSCPDWPHCYGEWLPPFPSAETGGIDPDAVDHADAYTQAQIIYEWSHRLVASLLGIPFLAFLFLAATDRNYSKALRVTPILALIVLVIQVNLGGITVLGKNAAPLTTAHLATATIFFFLITWSAAVAFLKPFPMAGVKLTVHREARETQMVFPGEGEK